MTNEELIIELSQKYYKSLYQYVKQICDDKTIVADIVQDTFMIAYEKADTLQKHEDPVKWLYITAKFRMLQITATAIQYKDLDSIAESVPDDIEFENDVISNCDAMLEMTRSLEPHEIRLIIQHYREGYTPKELAEEYHTTPGSIKMRMQRAKQKLKMVLKGPA